MSGQYESGKIEAKTYKTSHWAQLSVTWHPSRLGQYRDILAGRAIKLFLSSSSCVASEKMKGRLQLSQTRGPGED